MKLAIATAALAALGLATAEPALAHHSAAMFDRSTTVTITGTVKSYLYTNPHSWITVVGTDADGATAQWDIEGYTPGAMKRFGLVPSTVVPGDKVTVVLHPLRDGRKGGSFVEYTFPNGKVVRP